jgi:SHO1 osmosensor
MHRFQISVFGAVAIVFSVQGVQDGIFSGDPALDAMSAGWLILSMVNILWVLYFTSEEDSLAFHVFNLMGTGGLTPPSRRRRAARGQSVANNGYAANYLPGGGIGSNNLPYDTKMDSGIGGGIRSQHSFGGVSGDAARSTLGAGTGGGSVHNLPAGGPGSTGGGDTNVGPNSPLMGSGAAGVGAGLSGTSSPPATSDLSPQPDGLAYKAKALYACESSPYTSLYLHNVCRRHCVTR